MEPTLLPGSQSRSRIQRLAWLYRIEADAKALTLHQRLQMHQERSQPL